jgi:hypothetical protein
MYSSFTGFFGQSSLVSFRCEAVIELVNSIHCAWCSAIVWFDTSLTPADDGGDMFRLNHLWTPSKLHGVTTKKLLMFTEEIVIAVYRPFVVREKPSFIVRDVSELLLSLLLFQTKLLCLPTM